MSGREEVSDRGRQRLPQVHLLACRPEPGPSRGPSLGHATPRAGTPSHTGWPGASAAPRVGSRPLGLTLDTRAATAAQGLGLRFWTARGVRQARRHLRPQPPDPSPVSSAGPSGRRPPLGGGGRKSRSSHQETASGEPTGTLTRERGPLDTARLGRREEPRAGDTECACAEPAPGFKGAAPRSQQAAARASSLVSTWLLPQRTRHKEVALLLELSSRREQGKCDILLRVMDGAVQGVRSATSSCGRSKAYGDYPRLGAVGWGAGPH